LAWSDGETSADAAQVEVKAWFRGIAGKRGWSSTQLSSALALADEAYEAADAAEWFGASVRVFWEQMARGVQRPEFRGYPEWSNIADTVRQMLVTVDSVQQYQFDTSWYGGVIGGTAAAVADVAKAGEAVVEKTTNPKWVWGVAVALVALVALVKFPRRA
jgi:hypothetical protein